MVYDIEHFVFCIVSVCIVMLCTVLNYINWCSIVLDIVWYCIGLYNIAGKLTKSQIKAGYEALKLIETLIKAEDFGSKLTDANNAFYTRIPHDFGYVCTYHGDANDIMGCLLSESWLVNSMRAPERIVAMDILKRKMTLLEVQNLFASTWYYSVPLYVVSHASVMSFRLWVTLRSQIGRASCRERV